MTRLVAAGLAFALAGSGCVIDERQVEVRPSCVAAPDGGLISDFSSARLGRCGPPTCSDAFTAAPEVALGGPDFSGLIFPTQQTAGTVLVLGLTGDVLAESDPSSALRVVTRLDPAGQPDVAALRTAFTLQFIGCLDSTGFAGISFRTDGDLKPCLELRVAARLAEAHAEARAPGPGCASDVCLAEGSTSVQTGLTTLAFPEPTLGNLVNTFKSLEWNARIPEKSVDICTSDFTIDDIRLVREL
jgi:hypothetical protein